MDAAIASKLSPLCRSLLRCSDSPDLDKSLSNSLSRRFLSILETHDQPLSAKKAASEFRLSIHNFEVGPKCLSLLPPRLCRPFFAVAGARVGPNTVVRIPGFCSSLQVTIKLLNILFSHQMFHSTVSGKGLTSSSSDESKRSPRSPS